jgi:high-affinity nickel permease
MESAPEISVISLLLIGFALGLQHAVEADHLAAVSTIVSEKKDLLSATIVGGLWGVGHTLALLMVGAVVVILKVQISQTTETHLEGVVGVMLIALGINALRKPLMADKYHLHTHEHEGREHAHFHAHENGQRRAGHHRYSVRSILVGMVHGLAGSAGLMLLVVPATQTPATALGYIAVFGVGSIIGMAAMSFLFGLPVKFAAERLSSFRTGIQVTAGIFSFLLGGYIVYEKLVAVRNF